MNIDEELSRVGLTREQYEAYMDDVSDKINGLNDMDWGEIQEKHNISLNNDGIRKANSRPFGAAFAKEYYSNKNISDSDLNKKLDEIRKEKIKLQTLNVERSRLDRAEARQELYFETFKKVIEELNPPDFNPLFKSGKNDKNMSYILTLADFHYGAAYASQNNIYSPEIAKQRLEYVCSEMKNFVENHKVNTLNILSLGDSIQGCLRLSDLKLNDTSVVKAIVEVSRLLANFLNQLSAFVNIKYYHVPSANHSQLRMLGAKASELVDEDVEYIIGNYIKDLVGNNKRIEVILADEDSQYVKVDLPNYRIYAMHGHQIKSMENSIRDLSMLVGNQIDYLFLGHFHNGREIPSYECGTCDAEVLIAPAFCGSDPYSDRIMRGSKAAVKIYGFDDISGHTESYKIILN